MSAYYFPIEKGKSPLNMQFEMRMLRLGFPLYVSATDYFFMGIALVKFVYIPCLPLETTE